MLVLAGTGEKGNAGVICYAGAFKFYELQDFRIRSIQLLKLFDRAGIHTHSIQRAIVRQRMLMAPQKKKTHTKKQ
jgi:hypothetical protein